MYRTTLWNISLYLGGMAALISAASRPTCAQTTPARPTAVATIFAYYDALRAIGGPDVDSIILLPARQTPHDYQPTVKDRATVAQASLIVENGLGIDPWVDGLRADNRSATVINVAELIRSKGIQPLKTQETSIAATAQSQPGVTVDVSAGNPHIWLDPRVQAMAAEAIRDALVKIDPAHADGYRQRARTYLADLDKLDKDFSLAARQFKQKDFIGFHSAYAYLANRYGLRQVAAIEELPDQGPSLAQQANIVRLIRDKHIKVIFTETALPARAADRIIAETGVKMSILQPLETYDSPDQTYVSLMRENLKALKEALN